MLGPSGFAIICQTDVEFGLLHARIEALRTTTFNVVTGPASYMGHAVRDFRADPVSRLLQIRFLEPLIEQLQVVPPLAGVPFDFEPTLLALEKFVFSHPFFSNR